MGCRWWQWVTRAYRGLQKVTGGYKRLQGGTKGYRGLQEVTDRDKELQGNTSGYRGLQGVTEGYKGLQRGYRQTCFLTRTSKGTFSGYTLK